MSKVVLKYKQRAIKPSVLVEKYGMKMHKTQYGTIDYDQEEVLDINDVNKRVIELKSFSNRDYHSFKIN
jgi:hypothetical protein